MNTDTASLARSITWKGSKQTFFTARLLVDRDLVDDFYRAYAYFRWADDIVDDPDLDAGTRIAFIRRQRQLIDGLYAGRSFSGLVDEERLISDLVSHEKDPGGGLQSFIRNMFAIIEFDALRKDRLIDNDELDWYSESLGRSVTDGIQYFIAHGHNYPDTPSRLSAARAAHLAHLLRDIRDDTAEGFFNIPREYLESRGIGPAELDSEAYRQWVKSRVEQARAGFSEGKRYLDGLEVLRCKLAGYLYCTRFETVLDTIEADGYYIREDYRGRRDKLASSLHMLASTMKVTVRHYMDR